MKWPQKAVVYSIVILFSWVALFFPRASASAGETNDLWLEMAPNYYPVQTNDVVWTNKSGVVRTNVYVTRTFNAATFIIHPPETNADGVFDLYSKTDLTDARDWTRLVRIPPDQSNLVISNLSPEQSFFRLGAPDAIRPGFDQQFLEANDDGSTDLVPIGFNINFYGSFNNELYVNNNGDVTFENPQWDYTPKGLTNLGLVVIAPFWADVDTRGTNSDVVRYGTNTLNGCNAFGVSWVNVGYYNSESDRLLSCQLVIINHADIAPGDFDLEFNYTKVQWQWGDVTSGVPPQAGFANSSNGYELPGSGVADAFMDTNTVTGLVYHSLNSSVPGRYVFYFRDGSLQGPLP